MILVDTNVLIDVATRDPDWAFWSLSQLEKAARQGSLRINDVVYAELSVRYEQMAELDDFLAQAEIETVSIPKEALFLAGKVFARYRQAGGTRTGVIPDFFIGAHAQTAGVSLLTRDKGRYGTYFPSVALITP